MCVSISFPPIITIKFHITSDLPHLHYAAQFQLSQSAANFTDTVPAMRSFHVEKLEFIGVVYTKYLFLLFLEFQTEKKLYLVIPH